MTPITDAELAEALGDLTHSLILAREETQILRITLEAVAKLFRAEHVHFAEHDAKLDRIAVVEYRSGDPGAIFASTVPLELLGGQGWWQRYSPGGVAVEEALASELLSPQLRPPAARAFSVQAMATASGRVTLGVAVEVPRVWSCDELTALEKILARLWPFVERARSDAAVAAELAAAKQLLLARHEIELQGRAQAPIARIAAESARRSRLHETILSSAPDQIYALDLQFRFSYVNSALLETWGRTWSEVIGKTFLEIGYPDWHAAMHSSELEQVLVSKRSIRGEVPFKAVQGDRIHDYIFAPVLGADGEVEAIAGTTRDVTELKQAEYLMAGQAAVLELMVKGAPLLQVLEALCDAVDQQATDRRYACISLMAEDGASLRIVAGRHVPLAWRRSVDPWPIGPASGSCGTAAFRREPVVVLDVLADPLWLDFRQRAIAHGLRSCWSSPIFSSDGAVLGTFDLYYQAVHEPGAAELRMVELVTRTAGVAIERRSAEQHLKIQTERQRLLWEAAAALLTTDEPDAMMRDSFLRLAPHFELDVCLNHMRDTTEGGLRLLSHTGIEGPLLERLAHLELGDEICGDVEETREPFAVSFLQTANAGYPLLQHMGLRAFVCVPMLADGRLIGTLAFGSKRREKFSADDVEFLRTVTRYVTAAYERLHLVKELREADRKKDDFIALLAHELRNPLAPLRNGLHVMRLSQEPSSVARAHTIMERQLTHMVRLIDDLLDVSRISLNKMELRRARVTLSDVVNSAVESARPALDAAEHELTVEIPAEPVFLHADLTRLAQVLGNLLTNAAKYTPKGGRIRLEAGTHGDEVAIVVQDNGIGLHPQALTSIFGMFSQVDHGVDRARGGLGIGLALVKGLTEMHGGSVRAESAGPGHGSRFEVRLPVARQAANAEGGHVSSKPPPSSTVPRRILVVDDNVDALESTATMLRLAGNEVHTASDGIDALQSAEALRPQVVLMDIGMPRLNGYEATRRLRSQDWGKAIVVIALTGWGQESDRRQSREAGCDYHLVKPADFGQLQQVIDALCRAR